MPGMYFAFETAALIGLGLTWMWHVHWSKSQTRVIINKLITIGHDVEKR